MEHRVPQAKVYDRKANARNYPLTPRPAQSPYSSQTLSNMYLCIARVELLDLR